MMNLNPSFVYSKPRTLFTDKKPAATEEESKALSAAGASFSMQESMAKKIDSPPSLRKRSAKVLNLSDSDDEVEPEKDKKRAKRTAGKLDFSKILVPKSSGLPPSPQKLPPSVASAQQKLSFEEETKAKSSLEEIAGKEKKATKPIIKSSIFVPSHKNIIITINNEKYTLQKITDGDYHAVYAFLDQKSLTIDNVTIPDVRTIVLKCATKTPKCYQSSGPLITAKRKKMEERIQTDCARALEAYEYLRSNAIPIPKVYLKPWNPDSLFDLTDGNFWLMERTTTHNAAAWGNISVDFMKLIGTEGPDRKLALFVREHLTKGAQVGMSTYKEHINDFFPRNVMWDSHGNPCIVDFSLPEKDPIYKLFHSALAWSFGKEEIWKFMIKDFPDEAAKQMNERLVDKIKVDKCLGFPISDKSKMPV